jgi:hypothetical protein
MEGGKVLHVHYLDGLDKSCVETPSSHKRLEVDKGINGWYVVCMGKGAKIRFMVACEKTIEMTNVNYKV